MQRHRRFHLLSRPPIGLRTLKTGLSVTLALLLCRVIPDGTPFYAALGALVAMDRTFADSLRASATQLVGLLCGSLFGFLLVHFVPNPSAWLIGLGTVLVITVCNYGRIPFTTSLSCLIFLSICTTPGSSTLLSTALRLRDTSVGLLVALVVNVLLQPYNNTKSMLRLLASVPKDAISCLETILLRDCYPDLRELERSLRKLNRELGVFRRQSLLRRKTEPHDLAYMEGCLQLAERILQELEAVSCMDCFGNLGLENAARLRARGLAVPQPPEKRVCTRHDTIVMNYHIGKLLDACGYLEALLKE